MSNKTMKPYVILWQGADIETEAEKLAAILAKWEMDKGVNIATHNGKFYAFIHRSHPGGGLVGATCSNRFDARLSLMERWESMSDDEGRAMFTRAGGAK